MASLLRQSAGVAGRHLRPGGDRASTSQATAAKQQSERPDAFSDTIEEQMNRHRELDPFETHKPAATRGLVNAFDKLRLSSAFCRMPLAFQTRGYSTQPALREVEENSAPTHQERFRSEADKKAKQAVLAGIAETDSGVAQSATPVQSERSRRANTFHADTKESTPISVEPASEIPVAPTPTQIVRHVKERLSQECQNGFTQLYTNCVCGRSAEYEALRPNAVRAPNAQTVFVNYDSGLLLCTLCRCKGTVAIGEPVSASKGASTVNSVVPKVTKTGERAIWTSAILSIEFKDDFRQPADDSGLTDVWKRSRSILDFPEVEVREKMSALNMPKSLDLKTFEQFCVRVHRDESGSFEFLFPRFAYYPSKDELPTPTSLRRRVPTPTGLRRLGFTGEIGGDGQPVIRDEKLPRENFGGLFGFNLIEKDSLNVVLTEDELDAMAVWQATRRPVLANPSGGLKLPQEALPYLEQFEDLCMWYPPQAKDLPIRDKVTRDAEKVGLGRCRFVDYDELKRENAERMKKGLRRIRTVYDRPIVEVARLETKEDLKAVLDAAKRVAHKNVETFTHLRLRVKDEIVARAANEAALKWRRYPELSAILKGFRAGELTLLTGPTGAGKTTFLSEYSLDLLEQGVNTLWGSFEISNPRLLETMIRQHARATDLETNFDHYADMFERLPLYNLAFYGTTNIDELEKEIKSVIDVHGVQHVCIDNLQFMLGTPDDASVGFAEQDRAISRFRKLAHEKRVHVTLVIHPRKELAGALTVQSIYGGVRASQEADNVIIIQQRSARGEMDKYLQVHKNRYDGTMRMDDRLKMQFDEVTRCYRLEEAEEEEEDGAPRKRGKGEGAGGRAIRGVTRTKDYPNEFPSE